MAIKKIISITLDGAVIDEIDELAQINCRNRSNMIESVLREWLQQFNQEEEEHDIWES